MLKLRSVVYTTEAILAMMDRCEFASQRDASLIQCPSMENAESLMDKKSDRKLVSFRLPEELMQELRERADQSGISVTELVYRFLRQGLQTTVDERIASLEAEVQELRKLKQVNLNPISSTPVYTLLPPSFATSNVDGETKQRIDRLEARVEEVLTSFERVSALPDYLAKLQALIEDVQTNQATASGSSVQIAKPSKEEEPSKLDKSASQINSAIGFRKLG